jgi:hypothetical protein
MAAGTGSHGHLRASRADREHAIDVLKAAFVQGRLTQDELDERAGQVFASRTYAELAAVTADIPAGLAVARASSMPARAQAQQPVTVNTKAGVNASIVTALCVALICAFAMYTNQQWLFLMSVGGTGAAAFVACFLAAAQKLSSRLDKNDGGRLQSRQVSAAEADQAPQLNQAPPHEAEAASRFPRRRPPSSWRLPSRGSLRVGYADY